MLYYELNPFWSEIDRMLQTARTGVHDIIYIKYRLI